MAEETDKTYTIVGFEGIQRKTSRFLKTKGELDDGINAVFSTIIGGVAKRKGHLQTGDDLTSTTSTSTSTSTTTTSTSTSTTTSTSSSTSTTTTSTTTT